VGCSSLIILPMQPEDLPEILTLEADALSAWNRDQLEAELEQPTGFQFVVRRKGTDKIIAFLCGRVMVDEAEILKLSVAQSERRKGVGRQLLHFVVKLYSEKGVKNCFLELRASNTAARNLYEKEGFSIIGKRNNYYMEPAEDAILMKRKIENSNPNTIIR
jgi:ribosomal-protein-alanine N-acetyltransferase